MMVKNFLSRVVVVAIVHLLTVDNVIAVQQTVVSDADKCLGSGIGVLGSITTGAAVKNGDVWMWGFRNAGISGMGSTSYSSYKDVNKVPFPNNEKISKLVSGAYHFLALTEDGEVYGWGQSGYGEVGCRNSRYNPYVSTPCKVPFPQMKAGDRVVHIAAGEYFSLAQTEQGDVYTWGHDLYGQVGRGERVAYDASGPVKNVDHPSYSDGKTVPKNNASMQFVPYKVNLNGEKAVVSGAWYEGAMAVTENGHVYGWGDNEATGLGVEYTCPGTPHRGVQCVVRTPSRANMALESLANTDEIVYLSGGNAFGAAQLKSGDLVGWGQLAAIGHGTKHDGTPGDTVEATLEPKYMRLIDPETGDEYQAKRYIARYVGNIAIGTDGRLWVWGQGTGSAFPQIYPARPTPHGTASTIPQDLGVNSALRSEIEGAHIVDIGCTKEVVYYRMSDGSTYGLGYNSVNSLNPIGCPYSGKEDTIYWGTGGYGGKETMHGYGSLSNVKFGGVRLCFMDDLTSTTPYVDPCENMSPPVPPVLK